MARGFESKDVEYQQAESQRSRTIVPAVTPEQRETRERRRSLELSLARAEADLRNATSSAHRHMLEQAIAALRARLGSG
jgi:putative hemolysin